MNLKTIFVNTVISGALLIAFYYLLNSKKEKIAYVKLGKLYQEYQMKKDLENKYQNVESARKSALDSMELELGLLYKKLGGMKNPEKALVEEYEAKKEKYFMKKQQFNEDNKQVVEQYQEQIMKKLNEKVDAYGKMKGYTFILGADGNGTIMHAEDEKDITDEVVKFINGTYNGEIK